MLKKNKNTELFLKSQNNKKDKELQIIYKDQYNKEKNDNLIPQKSDISIGNDIINISRIEKSILKFGNKFITRIYTKNEIELAKKLTIPKKIFSFYAKRFAAKEAFAKAIGSGFGKNISFTDIEILNHSSGKPFVNVFNYLKIILGDSKVEISLSDDYPFAIATILIVS